MPTIKFFIQTKKNPAAIYVRLRDGVSIDCKAKTLFAINPEHWDSSKKKGRSGQGISKAALRDADLKLLHAKLETFRATLLGYYNQRASVDRIDSGWLKYFIWPTKAKSEVPETLTDYFEYYAKHKKSEVRASTFSKLGGIRNLLLKFEESQGKPTLIEDVGSEFKLKFEKYCIGEKYSPNTIARLLRFIKTVCYHAGKNGIQINKQLSDIKSKLVSVDKIHFPFEEIDKIYTTVLEQDYLDNARDWLVISCDTGQRVSDFMRFRSTMLRVQGEHTFVDFKQVKTGALVSVPLTSRVKAILAKRNGEFPRKISEQRYNDYIKEVAQLAGITQKIEGGKVNPETNRKEKGVFEKWELVSSHIGRRSFATNNYGKVPTSILKFMTGHASEAQFLSYVGKTQSESAMQAAEYFK
jgi:integrase